MAKVDIWMPDFIGDHLRDCALMTHEQHSVYVYLRLAYWGNGGPLPDQDEVLARAANLSVAEWKKQRQIHARSYEIGGGFWTNPVLDEEIQKAKDRRDSARKNGKKGGRPRGSKNPPVNPPVNPQVNPSVNPSHNPEPNPQKTSSPSPSPIPLQPFSLPRKELDISTEYLGGGE